MLHLHHPLGSLHLNQDGRHFTVKSERAAADRFAASFEPAPAAQVGLNYKGEAEGHYEGEKDDIDRVERA